MPAAVVISRRDLVVTCSHGSRGHRPGGAGARRWSKPSPLTVQRDSPLRRCLRSTLALKEPLLDQLAALSADLNALTAAEVAELVQPNLRLLGGLAPAPQLKRAVCRNPRLLLAPLDSWHSFISAYYCDQLESRLFWQLVTHPTLLQQGSVFRAGRAIMFLRELGWSDLEIRSVVFPHHPAILQQDEQQQLRPVLQHLRDDCGLSATAAADFLRRHPYVLCDEGFRGQVQQLLRKEQRLAMQVL